MHRTLLAFAVVVSLVMPVLAQGDKNAGTSESECADRFKASDLNNDSVLTPTEIPNAQQLPPTLAKESLISRKEYVAACVKLPIAQGSPHSTGQTVVPDTKGQQQPQGPTGPLETKSGGAPAESPQGQTPPGMQSAPEGSSKTIIDPDTKK